MPTLKYGHLADYATIGANGKPILVGIFDRIVHLSAERPIPVPPSYLLLALECSIGEGATHDIRIQLVDGNGDAVGEPQFFSALQFGPSGPGYPLHARILMWLLSLSVPDVGDYEFVVSAGGERIGEVPLLVVSQLPEEKPSAT